MDQPSLTRQSQDEVTTPIAGVSSRSNLRTPSGAGGSFDRRGNFCIDRALCPVSGDRAQMIWWLGNYPDLDRLTRMGENTMTGFLSIAFTDIGPDWLRAAMPVTAKTHQPFGRLHGGASVALAETVASTAGTLVVDPAKFAVVGMEINANHIRPAFGGFVHATAKAESLGRTTQIWTIRIENDEGKLICLSRFTAAVIATERK